MGVKTCQKQNRGADVEAAIQSILIHFYLYTADGKPFKCFTITQIKIQFNTLWKFKAKREEVGAGLGQPHRE